MHAPRFEPREVEQAVHEPREAHGAAVRRVKVGARERAAPGDRVLDRAEHERQRRPELVADVAEERGLRRVELAELHVRVAELADRRVELLASFDDLAFHRAAALVCRDELRHLDDAMQDVHHLARRREDWDVLRAPVFRLKTAVRPADVVLLDRHRVGRARRDHAIERSAQVARPRRLRVVGVVRKDLEEAAPHRSFTRRVRGLEPRVRRRDHRELRCVGKKHEEDLGRRLEEDAKIDGLHLAT